MKISVYIATSVDGFIARPDGGIDWLDNASNPDDKEGYGYDAFIESIDFIVMGRNSFEKVLSFGIEWPYTKPVIVLSTTLKSIPENLQNKVEIYSNSIESLLILLEERKCRRVYIDGGKTIQSFLSKRLVTDLTLTKIPILLGEGIPLFGAIEKDILLKHIETKSFPSGFVQSTYEL